MRYRSLCLCALLVILVLVAACIGGKAPAPQTPVPTPVPTTSPTPVPTPAYPPELAGQWVLQTMAIQAGSVPLTPTTQITLTMNADGSLTGYDGCNNYFGSFTLTGTQTPKGSGIVIGPVSTSKKYCATLATQEQNYLSILGKTGAYVVNGNLLTLTDDSQNALIYQRGSSILPTTQYFPQPA